MERWSRNSRCVETEFVTVQDAIRPDLNDPLTLWLTRIADYGATMPALEDTDPAVRREALRELSDRLAVEFTAPGPESVQISDVWVPRPDGSRLQIRRYLPADIEAPYPTQLWCHGGGFLLGQVDEIVNDRICAARAEAAGIQILSVGYRLAPEHPYPAGVDDLLTGYDVAHRDPDLAVDIERLGIGGISAGGFVAAVGALRIRDERTAQPTHVAFEVPMLAFVMTGDPSEHFASEADRAFLTEAMNSFLPPEVRDRYADLIEVEDLSGLPPTLLVTAEFDPLRDSGERYGARLRAAGNDLTLLREPGHLHGSSVLTAVSPRSRAWQDHVRDALRIAYRTD
jgi:acetyl esterase